MPPGLGATKHSPRIRSNSAFVSTNSRSFSTSRCLSAGQFRHWRGVWPAETKKGNGRDWWLPLWGGGTGNAANGSGAEAAATIMEEDEEEEDEEEDEEIGDIFWGLKWKWINEGDKGRWIGVGRKRTWKGRKWHPMNGGEGHGWHWHWGDEAIAVVVVAHWLLAFLVVPNNVQCPNAINMPSKNALQ
jgi:hypothetical protein